MARPWTLEPMPNIANLPLDYQPDSYAAVVEPASILEDKLTDVYIYMVDQQNYSNRNIQVLGPLCCPGGPCSKSTAFTHKIN